MALTSEQETILEEIIEAYQNGKKISELSDATLADLSAVIAEVVEAGASKKATLQAILSGYHDSAKQNVIDAQHKLSYSLISDTPTIPSKTSDLTNDSGFVDSSYHDSTKQDTLIAGSGITIGPDGKTISSTGGSSQWGGITGDIDNQTDLKYRLEEIEETYNSEAQPLVCGQPMVIFGAGTPDANNKPYNWIDAEHGGYDWGGQGAFAGQIYVNVSTTNNNKYVAVQTQQGGLDLTWK